MKPGAIILAAGASSRMGRSKPLLPWGHSSVIRHLVQAWEDIGAEVVVVVAAGDGPLMGELVGMPFPADHIVFNSNPEKGMFTSARAGAAWEGWKKVGGPVAIVLADQPHATGKFLRRIVHQASAYPGAIVQPEVAGQRGHPVMLPRTVLTALARSRAGNLKDFLTSRSEPRISVEMDDARSLDDMDFPADYKRARRGALSLV